MVKQNRHFSFFAIILMVLMTSYSCEKMDESEKGAQSPDKIKAQQENAIKKFLDKRPQFTTAADRLAGFEQRRALQENSLLSQVAFRNVGPSIMSGRVVDIDVDPRDAAHFYVAYASGGYGKQKIMGLLSCRCLITKRS